MGRKTVRLAAAASTTLVLGAALTVAAADREAPEAGVDLGNPVSGNSGFGVLTESDAVLGGVEAHGSVAVGGDLAFGRGTSVASKNRGGQGSSGSQGNAESSNGPESSDTPRGSDSAGSRAAPGAGRATALLVNGRIDYPNTARDGLLQVLGRGHVKVGNMTGSTALDSDDGGEPVNTQVMQEGGGLGSLPRIALGTHQRAETVRAPGLLDFAELFTAYRERAEAMGQCAESVTPRGSTGERLPNSRRAPAGSRLELPLAAERTNVLRLTGESLNNVEQFTLRDRPDARGPLVIVVDTTADGGELTWRTPEMTAPDGSAPHTIWVFPDATSLTVTGDGPVQGTVFAPRAKLAGVSTVGVEGGVVAHSLLTDSPANSPAGSPGGSPGGSSANSSAGYGRSAPATGALGGSPFDGSVTCHTAPTPRAPTPDHGS